MSGEMRGLRLRRRRAVGEVVGARRRHGLRFDLHVAGRRGRRRRAPSAQHWQAATVEGAAGQFMVSASVTGFRDREFLYVFSLIVK